MIMTMNTLGDPGVSDLLALIGNAVEKLQRSVSLFEESDRQAGIAELHEVIDGIDRYVQGMNDDPLLKLAAIDRELVIQKLNGVKQELFVIINALTAPSS